MFTQVCIKETGTANLERKTPQDTEADGLARPSPVLA